MKKFLMLITIGVIVFSVTGCLSEEELEQKKEEENVTSAKEEIEYLIEEKGSSLFLYSDYSIGKITSVNCENEENETDGKGRYLMRCEYTYNPKNRAGSTMLDREETSDVYAIYMDVGNDKYNYDFGHAGTVFIDEFKEENCWGKSKDLKLNCDKD